jgi:FtsH-binding integral membrane protein
MAFNQFDPDQSEMYESQDGGAVAAAAPAVRAAFLQKVYMTLCVGVLISLGTAFGLMQHALQALQTRQMDWLAKFSTGQSGYFLVFLLYIGMAFAAGALARRKGVNLIVYGAFTAVAGLLLTPLFLYAYVAAGQSYSVIWSAFGLTVLMFGGLTLFVMVTGADFSFMGGALFIGLLVLLGFMVATFFFQSPAFYTAVTLGGLLLFGLFVLYDTSMITHHLAADEWVAGALSLFIDFINIFIRILSLLSRNR